MAATKKFQHKFGVEAPLDQVRNFHTKTINMAVLTPFPVITRIHQAPPEIQEGEEMDFTLWFGPLPVRWRARFDSVSDHGFTDLQIQGPFNLWEHHHSFQAISPENTDVHDVIMIEFATNPWKRMLGIGMWITLPLLFIYRKWQTRRLLESRFA